LNYSPSLFSLLVIFQVGSQIFASDLDPPTYSLPCSWDHKCISPYLASCSAWVLLTFYPDWLKPDSPISAPE
jgi:hypothetical protein